jgi:hypothetical protein
MLLTTEQIDRSTGWLMEHASAPVRYLTHKYLRGAGRVADEEGLFQRVLACGDVKEILAAQQEDGSWCSGGSWAMSPSYLCKGIEGGYNAETPKYVTAIWVLPLLGDMGFVCPHERVRAACGYILESKGHAYYRSIFNDPDFGVSPDDVGFCGRFAQYLVALAKAGCGGDERARRGFRALVAAQRPDGGWVSSRCLAEKHWTRSCPFASYHSALALYSLNDARYRENLIKALDFLVWNLSIKSEEEIRRFFYHGQSTVHEMLMFSELKVGLDSRPVQILLDWFGSMYAPGEGVFRYAGKPVSQYSLRRDGMDARVAKYRLYHLAEDDWLTCYLTRIARNLLD